jgi:hypothetical protein
MVYDIKLCLKFQFVNNIQLLPPHEVNIESCKHDGGCFPGMIYTETNLKRACLTFVNSSEFAL